MNTETIDPATNQAFEEAATLAALLDAYPDLKCEIIFSFLQDYRTSQSVDSALWFACCEWDISMPSSEQTTETTGGEEIEF